MRAFSVFGILLVIQAAADIPAGINFACNSPGAFAFQHVKGCVVGARVSVYAYQCICFF